MTPAQIVEFRRLLAISAIPRSQLSRHDRGEGYPFERGFNSGLEHAEMLLNKALAFGPATGHQKPQVTYPEVYGPHRCALVREDGGWISATMEDV